MGIDYGVGDRLHDVRRASDDRLLYHLCGSQIALLADLLGLALTLPLRAATHPVCIPRPQHGIIRLVVEIGDSSRSTLGPVGIDAYLPEPQSTKEQDECDA